MRFSSLPSGDSSTIISPHILPKANGTCVMISAGSRLLVEFAADQAGLQRAALDRACGARGTRKQRIGEGGRDAERCGTAKKVTTAQLAEGNAPAEKFQFVRHV